MAARVTDKADGDIIRAPTATKWKASRPGMFVYGMELNQQLNP